MSGTTSGAFDWKAHFLDKHRLYQTMRITLANLLAYILSVYSFPKIIPPGLRYMIGVTVASVSLSVPSVVAAVPLVSTVIPFIVILGYAASTVILCGVLVSTGLMVALFVIITFWLSGLRFQGGLAGLVHADAAVLIVVLNMLSLSLYPLIQQADSPRAIAALWTASGLTNPAAVLQNLLVAICWAILCLWIIPLLPPLRTARSLLSQGLAPQALKGISGHLKSVSKTLPDSNNISNVVGEEDEAKEEVAYRTRCKALIHTAASIGDGSNAEMASMEPRLWRPLEVNWVPLKMMLQDIYLTMTIALALGNSIRERIKKQTSPSSSRNLDGTDLAEEGSRHMNALTADLVEECATALDQCADKLLSTKLEEAIQFTDLAERSSKHGGSDQDKIMLMEHVLMEMEPLLVAVSGIVAQVNQWDEHIYGPYKPPKSAKEIMSSVGTNYAPWLGTPYLMIKRLFVDEIVAVLNPKMYVGLFNEHVHKEGTDFRNPPGTTIAWFLKYTIGASILYIIQVYFPSTHSFAIPVFTADSSSVSFVGWVVIAYLNTTTPTVQGTVKKGIARLGGTVIGAFSAWAATHACGVYPDTNQVGLIAWLTIVTFIVTFVVVNPGIASMMGMRRDIGTLGMYLLMTQGLISLEAVNGSNDINDLTVNRMVANLAGIVMAIFMAMIPPTVNGADPGFTRNMVMAQRDALAYLIQLVLVPDDGQADVGKEEAAAARKSYAECVERVLYWQDLSTMLYKDASKLFPTLPVFTVDAEIMSTLEHAIMTGGCIHVLKLHTEWLMEKGELNFAQFKSIEPELVAIIQNEEREENLGAVSTAAGAATVEDGAETATPQGKEGSSVETSRKGSSPEGQLGVDVDARVKMFLSYAKYIDQSLTNREKELSQIRHTYFGSG
jgi:hypothetical protein